MDCWTSQPCGILLKFACGLQVRICFIVIKYLHPEIIEIVYYLLPDGFGI